MPAHLHRSWLRSLCYFLVGIVVTTVCWYPDWQSMQAQSSDSSMVVQQTLARRCASGFPRPALAPVGATPIRSPLSIEYQQQLDAGQHAYEAGRLSEAEGILTPVLNEFRVQDNRMGEAIALGNLALVFGQQGNWAAANQSIRQSIAVLTPATDPTTDATATFILAQSFNIQGRLQLGQGQSANAYDSWGQAAKLYGDVGQRSPQIRSYIRQARALQAQGFYQQAVQTMLCPLALQLQTAPPSLAQVNSLRSLGEAFQTVADLDVAYQLTDASLHMAQALLTNETEEADRRALIAPIQISLGNIRYAQALAEQADRNGQTDEYFQHAQDYYQTVFNQPQIPTNHRVSAMVNQLRLLVKWGEIDEAKRGDAIAFWSTIQSSSWPNGHPWNTQFPETREGVYAELNVVESLLALKRDADANGLLHTQTSSPAPWSLKTRRGLQSAEFSVLSSKAVNTELSQLLIQAEQTANQLGDRRAQSYVLGYWGKFYRHQKNLADAQQYTDKALVIAKHINATDIVYRWYEQAGNLFEQQQDKERAIAAYTGAVDTLKTLRSDLISINPEVQFSFEESIEPIHRKLVGLLLDPDSGQADSPARLEQATQVMDSLQVEELNDFLQADCLDRTSVSLSDLVKDQNVAVIYPIMLEDRLEIIAQLPHQDLRRYSPPDDLQLSKEALERIAQDFQDKAGTEFFSISLEFLDPSHALYQRLIEPMAHELVQTQPDTLVFVLDGALRNIPMAALFDGDHYLVEDYAIALTPGLQLTHVKSSKQQRTLDVLPFGLTEARGDFSPLPKVKDELETIQRIFQRQDIWLNNEFTNAATAEAIQSGSAPILHLATHGQFSSKLADTFLLSWDGIIQLNQLRTWIQNSKQPLDLLVLSACETAVGNRRAALGLAGIAVRAGARSTLASLWRVDDNATFEMMEQFYQDLRDAPSKAIALQQAQQSLLRDHPEFEHPFYWAPFVLVGNWL